MLPQKKINTKGTVLEKIFGECIHVEDIPESDTTPEMAVVRQHTTLAGNLVTQMVHTLRSDHRLPTKINQLGALMWNLIGSRTTPVALTVVSTISFIAEQKTIQDAPSGTILVPWNWVNKVKKDPYMQFGGLVSMGSQARDYYFNKLSRTSRTKKSRLVPGPFESEIFAFHQEGRSSLGTKRISAAGDVGISRWYCFIVTRVVLRRLRLQGLNMEVWWFIRRWWKQLIVLLLFVGLLWWHWPPRPPVPPPPPLAQEIYEEGRLTEITIEPQHISCVRWYTDHPEWCVIHTTDGRAYVLLWPGQKVWDWRFLIPDRPGTFKIRADNIDPISPNAKVSN